MKKLVPAFAVALALTTGCYKYNVKIGSGGNMSAPPVKTEWVHHFAFGMVGEGDIDVSSVCPSGNATVHIEKTAIDGIIDSLLAASYAFFWVWSPSTVTVYCGDGKVAQKELTVEEAVALARTEEFKDAVAAVSPERYPEFEAAVAAQ